MEFHEKLQELRRNRGLTQEELGEVLHVSRTAISKWESGRGYPNIDSLKEISNFFSVSIDDLLSGEKLLFLAENENKTNIRSFCDLSFGIVDLLSVILIILPLYPNTINDFVYSVNLVNYTQTTFFNKMICWIMFVSLILIGILNIVLVRINGVKCTKYFKSVSMVIGILVVLFLALTRQSYAVIMAFLLLIVKGIILLKHEKTV